MAAGRSTRMMTERPKVLHEVCGRPMLSYVLEACRANQVSRILVVVGYQKQQLIDHYAGQDDLVWVEQREQHGTGHAVMVCEEALSDFEGTVLVVAGDMPLVRPETMRRLLDTHEDSEAAATIATTILEDPTGYGRIVREADGKLLGIVEHRDCTAEQLAIRECNPSYYAFDKQSLFEALSQTDKDNAKGEYYITDAVKILNQAGRPVQALEAISAAEATGINDRRDLATVNRMMQERIQAELMDRGVTIVDPAKAWIEAGAQIAKDVVILPFSFIETAVKIGRDCRVGPFAHLREGTVVETGTRVEMVGVAPRADGAKAQARGR